MWVLTGLGMVLGKSCGLGDPRVGAMVAQRPSITVRRILELDRDAVMGPAWRRGRARGELGGDQLVGVGTGAARTASGTASARSRLLILTFCVRRSR